MITVALPSTELLERLSPAPAGVRFIVWDVDDEPITETIDLLVWRYMAPAASLRVLESMDVRAVQAQTLGFDGVAAALPSRTAFCNAVEVHEASTAELTLALLLAHFRGLIGLAEAQRDGRWAHAEFPGLAGRSILLIGVGGVGREIEARLTPFDVRLTRVARTARPGVHGLGALPGLLPAADAVIVAVPLDDETRGIVDAAFIASMQPGALLVNISRGAVVDTAALVDALERRAITAAIDVTDPEPLPEGHPLWTAPGVIITPHVGGHTGAMAARVDRVIRNQVDRLLAGSPLNNVVIAPTDSPHSTSAPTES